MAKEERWFVESGEPPGAFKKTGCAVIINYPELQMTDSGVLNIWFGEPPEALEKT